MRHRRWSRQRPDCLARSQPATVGDQQEHVRIRLVRQFIELDIASTAVVKLIHATIKPAAVQSHWHGETEDDALANAEDAIRLVIGYRQDHGEPIPAETTPRLRQVMVAVQA